MVTEESGHPGSVQRDRAQGPSPHKRQAEEQGLLGGQRRNCQEGEGKPRARGPRANGTALHTKVGGAGSDSEEAREAGWRSGRESVQEVVQTTRFHGVKNGWMGGEEGETVRLNSR